MQKDIEGPRKTEERPGDSSYNSKAPDQTPRREGGDDSLAEANPTDSNADEKVIVNEQRENKIVNAPSQTEANTSENISTDEEAIG